MSDHHDFGRLADGLSEPEAQAVRTAARYLQACQDPSSATDGGVSIQRIRDSLLKGAVAIPRPEWRVALDGFSLMFLDVTSHLWVVGDDGESHTLAEGVPLGQIYLDEKGSERDAVQVALNRSGSVYGDFRFMHRVPEPAAIYLKSAYDGEYFDLIVEGAGRYTVLETGLPVRLAPGSRSRGYIFPTLGEHRGT